jgi:hypothetical protein
LGLSSGSFSLRFPHHNPVYASPFPRTCYMPRPSQYSRFDHPNNIWCLFHCLGHTKVLV